MKILGVSTSPHKGGTTDRLVQEVLKGAECETEFVSLAGLEIRACTACLGCVEDNTCVIKDDMEGLRERIVGADAYVIGAPNYFSTANAAAHCFMERWYQFRHREGHAVSGKLGVAVGVGGGEPGAPINTIKTFFQFNQIECVGEVGAQGPACCFYCGYGETCKAGAIHMFFGPGTKITPEITPSLDKQPDCLARASEVGKALSDRLKTFAQGT